MKNILIILVIGIGLYIFKPDLFTFANSGAFNDEGNPQVWIFTFNECGQPCDKMLSVLEKRVDFIEYNISEDSGKQRLNDIGGGRQFPLIVIGNQRVKYNTEMQIVSSLAENIGLEAVSRSEQRVLQSHFYEDGTPAIIMYGTSWCPGCKKMRNYFNKNDIQFTELDAEGAALTDFTILKGGGYPLIYIGYRRIIGVNIKLLEETRKEFNI